MGIFIFIYLYIYLNICIHPGNLSYEDTKNDDFEIATPFNILQQFRAYVSMLGFKGVYKQNV